MDDTQKARLEELRAVEEVDRTEDQKAELETLEALAKEDTEPDVPPAE